jgi:hypothetical protein
MRKSLAPVSIDLGIRHTMLVSTFKSCAARMKMSLKRAVTAAAVPMLMGGCAWLGSHPYYKPSATELVTGKADVGGFLYVRLGGQNMLTTTETEVRTGVKSIGSMHPFTLLAMGPLVPIFPTFLTAPAPDEAHPIVLLEIYLSSINNNFTFNPTAVRVKNSQGVEYAPTSYIGPVDAVSGAFMFYRGEGVTSKDREIPLARNSSYCFVLEFDMKSAPDWNIQMFLNGLRTNGHAVPAPTFQFERDTAVYIIWGGREQFCSG